MLTEVIFIYTVSTECWLKSDIFSCSTCSECWLKWYIKKKGCSVTGDGIPVKDFVNNFSPVVPTYNKFEGSSEW